MTTSGKMIAKTGLAFLFFTMPLYSQITNGVAFTASFPFYVGKVLMPSGSYTVRQSDDTFLGVAVIQSTDGRHSASITVNPTESIQPPRVTSVSFEQYGDHMFFDRVRLAGDTYGIAAVPSTNEKMAEEMAAAGTSHSVEVAGQ
jgi:hypothetical protein